MASYFRIGCSDIDEIWDIYAEYHADYGNMVEMGTGSRIPIWRILFFPNGNNYISLNRLLSHVDKILPSETF